MYDLAQSPTGFRRKHRVNVIGHDPPGVQEVPLAIVIQQRVLNDLGQTLVSQIAASVTSIEIGVNPFAAFEVKVRFRKMP